MIEKAKQTWYWTIGGVGAILATTLIVIWLMGVFDFLVVR